MGIFNAFMLSVNILSFIVTFIILLCMMDKESCRTDIKTMFTNGIRVKDLFFILLPGLLLGILFMKLCISFYESFSAKDSIWNAQLITRKKPKDSVLYGTEELKDDPNFKFYTRC